MDVWCSRCEKHKPRDCFYTRGGSRAGKPMAICKSCRSKFHRRTPEANAAYYKVRHDIFVAARSKPCLRCKELFPVVCMDLHHRDPKTKAKDWANRYHWPDLNRVYAEIAKCDVVCSNCHRIIEDERRR